jgi:hypothetical protein
MLQAPSMSRLFALPVFGLTLAVAGCASGASGATSTGGSGGNGGQSGAVLLEAFFGLDDALPMTANLLCMGGSGMDGMPVTFSRRIAVDAPEASAFRVTTASGKVLTPRCATLRPALGASKRHTALLIGEFGDDPSDPPVSVEIIGSVPLENGGDAKGLSLATVTPLADGPSLRIGYRYAPAALPDSDCPSSTKQIVQLTWAGGVRATTGDEFGDAERLRMQVTLEGGEVVTPIALADLGDNDNYTHLCLDSATPATSAAVEAGVAIDPRGDKNPATAISVTLDPEAAQ